MADHTAPGSGDDHDEVDEVADDPVEPTGDDAADDAFDDDLDDDGYPEYPEDDGDEDDEDDDLWGGAEPITVNRNVVIGVGVAVALVILAIVIFGGGDDGGDDKDGTAAKSTATTPGGATQVTSQRAPFGAKELSPTTLPPGAVPRGCGTWDTAFNNPPKAVADGVFIWSDFKGWHVRLAGPTISSLSGSVRGQYQPPLQSPATAPGVKVTPDAAGKRLAFELVAGDQPVGFDFSAGCNQKELTFELTSGGTTVALDRIHLGSKGVVKEFPLVARRTLPPAG